MLTPLRITIRDLPASSLLETQIRSHAATLETICARLTGCHVTVDSPRSQREQGNHYRVRIDLTVPGSVLVLNREPAQQHGHEDARAAVDAAFDDAGRLLREDANRAVRAARGLRAGGIQ